MNDTIQKLEAEAEIARQGDRRDRFLEIQKEISSIKENEVLDRHKRYVDSVTQEFPVGTYISEIGARVKEIKDGCGTLRGWVEIYLSGFDKPLSPQELHRKITKARVKARASARAHKFINALKYSDRNLLDFTVPKSLYIGDDHIETLETLITAMDLDLPTYEEIDDMNLGFYEESYEYTYKQAVENGYSDNKAGGIAMDARDKAASKTYTDWFNSVKRTINHLLKFHHLKLVSEGEKIYIEAPQSWKKAASQTAETITGCGSFSYNSAKELRDVGPYKSYCEAVIKHLHWLKRYPDVYEGTDYRKIYEQE